MNAERPYIRQICNWELTPIEEEEPNPVRGDVILAYTCGQGFRILTYSTRNQCWEKQDGREDRLAIHKWCYLGQTR